MTEDEISTAIDNVAAALYGQGMDAVQVKRTITEEAERACDELENEANDFTR